MHRLPAPLPLLNPPLTPGYLTCSPCKKNIRAVIWIARQKGDAVTMNADIQECNGLWVQVWICIWFTFQTLESRAMAVYQLKQLWQVKLGVLYYRYRCTWSVFTFQLNLSSLGWKIMLLQQFEVQCVSTKFQINPLEVIFVGHFILVRRCNVM